MSSYVCASCGARHEQLPLCFLAPMPAHAAGIPEDDRPQRVELTSDQCVIDGENFFILGNLDIPIVGHDETVRWSVWSSLSAKNFERACDLWDAEGRESEPPYFGWLSTNIPGYPATLNLPLEVHTQPVGVRPLIIVAEQDHPLYREQSAGITWERACELSRAAT